MHSHDTEFAAAGGYGLTVDQLIRDTMRTTDRGFTLDQLTTAVTQRHGHPVPIDRVRAALSKLGGDYQVVQRDGLWFWRDSNPTGSRDWTDPAEQLAALQEARAKWDHGDAPYEPTVLGLIRAAEAMRRQLDVATSEIADLVDVVAELTAARLAGGELERRLQAIKDRVRTAGEARKPAGD
jgi:hypothetical protein